MSRAMEQAAAYAAGAKSDGFATAWVRNQLRAYTRASRGWPETVTMIALAVCIDVPHLERGVRFYAEALGFAKVAEPHSHAAALQVDEVRIALLEKREQSKSSPNADEVRLSHRHWTPVHLYFHVGDDSAAFCVDFFGHVFSLLQRMSAVAGPPMWSDRL